MVEEIVCLIQRIYFFIFFITMMKLSKRTNEQQKTPLCSIQMCRICIACESKPGSWRVYSKAVKSVFVWTLVFRGRDSLKQMASAGLACLRAVCHQRFQCAAVGLDWGWHRVVVGRK